jgi:hypothetical protein
MVCAFIIAPPLKIVKDGAPRSSVQGPGHPSGTTVACAQPCVILSEAKNLSVTVIAIRKTTERFFASLRMTACRADAHRTLNGLRFYRCPTLEQHKGAPPVSSKPLKGRATRLLLC